MWCFVFQIPVWLKGPPSFLFNKSRGSFLGVKQVERETNHSLVSSVGVKNEWSCFSAPNLCLRTRNLAGGGR
jgi:hypothetical protein